MAVNRSQQRSKQLRAGRRPSGQRGVAAVEFAILLPVLVVLLVFPIFFARVLMHYTVAAKASQAATQYLATIPRQEMESGSRKTAAVAIAQGMADATLAEMRPGGEYPIGVDIHCDGLACLGPAAPKEVRVTVRMWMYDDIFPGFTSAFIPDTGIAIKYSSTMAYFGD